jgi:hypothetical protein
VQHRRLGGGLFYQEQPGDKTTNHDDGQREKSFHRTDVSISFCAAMNAS